MPVMTTERLLIRSFAPDDWRDLHEYLSQQEVLRYEPEDANSVEECRKKALERSEGNAFWAVCLRESRKMIGHLYFEQTGPQQYLTWELGYIFNPAYYGRGYATEACRRILHYGFSELRAHRVVAFCNPENPASWKLLERLALRREGHSRKAAFFRRTPGGEPLWHDAYQYAILAEEWPATQV